MPGQGESFRLPVEADPEAGSNTSRLKGTLCPRQRQETVI